jgi:serine protease Do
MMFNDDEWVNGGEQKNSSTPEDDAEKKSEKNESDYSYTKQDIPESRIEVNRNQSNNYYQNNYRTGSERQFDPSQNNREFEISYNSQNGSYYNNTGIGQKAAPQPKKKGAGGLIAALCLCLVLSCGFGAVGGYLAGTAAKSESVNDTVPSAAESPSDTVNRYVTTIINQADNQESAISTAAAISHQSVVIIDTYYSEQYAELDEASGAGSGVVWTSDGYITTCNHVIDGAGVIKVTTADGDSYYADVVGTDAETDIAVLKITPDQALSPVIVRDVDSSPLKLGETVIAIGNPLGVLGGTVTSGILSALERNITVEGTSMTLLQMDASVNSGNSGGGLFDINGSLIGIVNAKSSGSDVEGIGFAIPISTVYKVASELIEYGYVTGRPQLGISIVGVTESNYSYIFGADYYPELRSYATKTGNDGWGHTTSRIVTGVYIYSTDSVVGYAEGSGELNFGDKLLYIGSTPIDDISDITGCLSGYSAGDVIDVTVLRNQTTTVIVQVVLGQVGGN